MERTIRVNGRVRHVDVHRAGGRFVVSVDGRERTVDAARVDPRTLSLLVQEKGSGGSNFEITLVEDAASGGLTVLVGTTPVDVSFEGRGRRRGGDSGPESGSGPQRLTAPMPGRIVRVLVRPGEAVTARQPVVVIEAMKMENELRAAANGRVAEVHVQDGQSVEAGALLAVIHR